jgi:glycosyltransferase involved in cell wall biosynthesis
MRTAPRDQGTEVPAVSIGMPIYNGERFLREALDSALKQTLTDFELIIADNNSSDATE